MNCQDDRAAFIVTALYVVKELNHLQSVACMKMYTRPAHAPLVQVWAEEDLLCPWLTFLLCLLIVRNRFPSLKKAPFSQLYRIHCKLNSCTPPAPPAARRSMTQCSHSKQTDGHYIQGFCKKRVCNHFHEAQGCCSSPAAHEIWSVNIKKKRERKKTSHIELYQISHSVCYSLFLSSTQQHPYSLHLPPSWELKLTFRCVSSGPTLTKCFFEV